jgi:hypothetical protein
MNPNEGAEFCFRETVKECLRLWKSPAFQAEVSDRNANAWFADKIAPFAGIKREKPHLALSVSRVPVLDCPWAYADVDVEQCGKEAVLGHSVIYLDLAERVFMMPGGVFQVRSLFVWHDGEHFRFCAALTRPGTNKGWLFAWREGHHARSSVDRVFDEVFALPSYQIEDRSRPINRQKIDYDRFADVERLAWLSLANWKTVVEFGAPPMPWPRLPTIHNNPMLEEFLDDDLVQEEPFSMFNVVRLPPLDDDRVQQVRQGISGMTQRPRKRKNAEHEVDGHYRWQAYGPKRSLRKRIWIDGHRRGKGAPKSVMNVLPATNRLAA